MIHRKLFRVFHDCDQYYYNAHTVQYCLVNFPQQLWFLLQFLNLLGCITDRQTSNCYVIYDTKNYLFSDLVHLHCNECGTTQVSRDFKYPYHYNIAHKNVQYKKYCTKIILLFTHSLSFELWYGAWADKTYLTVKQTNTSDLVILSQWLNDHSYLKIHLNFQLFSSFYNRPHS